MDFSTGVTGQLHPDSSFANSSVHPTCATQTQQLPVMEDTDCAPKREGKFFKHVQPPSPSTSSPASSLSYEVQQVFPKELEPCPDTRELEIDGGDVCNDLLSWFDSSDLSEFLTDLPLNLQEPEDSALQLQLLSQMEGWNNISAPPNPTDGCSLVPPKFGSLQGWCEFQSEAETSAPFVNHVNFDSHHLQACQTELHRSLCFENPFPTTPVKSTVINGSTRQASIAPVNTERTANSPVRSGPSISLQTLKAGRSTMKRRRQDWHANKTEESRAKLEKHSRIYSQPSIRPITELHGRLQQAPHFLRNDCQRPPSGPQTSAIYERVIPSLNVKSISSGPPRVSKLPRRKSCRNRKWPASDGFDAMSPHQADDHVQRERKRRDDMTSKVAILDVMLPPRTYRRDRVATVQETILHVKRLQQEVRDLQELFVKANCKAALCTDSVQTSLKGGESGEPTLKALAASGLGTATPIQCEKVEASIPQFCTTSVRTTNADDPSSSCRSKSVCVEFHVLIDNATGADEVKIFRGPCKGNYMSLTMKILEEFQLDLCRCTLTKLTQYFICILFAKPRSSPSTVMTNQVANQLQSAVGF